jgi:hypothetical protein
MIDEVDAALGRLLKRELGRGAEVSFAAPAASWAEGERKRALLDVHLFEVREEMSMRASGLERTTPTTDGEPVRRRPATRWFRLTYWLSAWASDAESEHRVLGAALAALARYEALPVDVLGERFEQLGLPLRMSVATPAADDPEVTAVWSSLSVPLRAALALSVGAPLDVPAALEAGPPVVERQVRFGSPMPPAPAAPAPREELLLSPDPNVPPRLLDEGEPAAKKPAGRKK